MGRYTAWWTRRCCVKGLSCPEIPFLELYFQETGAPLRITSCQYLRLEWYLFGAAGEARPAVPNQFPCAGCGPGGIHYEFPDAIPRTAAAVPVSPQYCGRGPDLRH